MGIIINTERLLIRELHKSDAAILNEICNEPSILKWMPNWETSLEQTQDWLKRACGQYEIATKQNAYLYRAIILKLTSEFIGIVGVANKEEVDNEVEIMYFISEEFSNRGYITEAVKGATSCAFNFYGFDYIIAIVETDNYPSQRVVEKCGFEKIGTKMILNSGEKEEKPFYYYRLYNSSKERKNCGK